MVKTKINFITNDRDVDLYNDQLYSFTEGPQPVVNEYNRSVM